MCPKFIMSTPHPIINQFPITNRSQHDALWHVWRRTLKSICTDSILIHVIILQQTLRSSNINSMELTCTHRWHSGCGYRMDWSVLIGYKVGFGLWLLCVWIFCVCCGVLFVCLREQFQSIKIRVSLFL